MPDDTVAAPVAQGFNLSAARQIVAREEEGADLPIKGADGKPLFYLDGTEQKPVTVGVIGSYSSTFRKLMTERTQLAKRLGREPTPEEERAADLDLIASCVTRWAGFFDGDTPLPCTKANVLDALTIPWIEVQIDRGAVTHDRFFGASVAA